MNKTFTALIAVAMALSAPAVDTSIAYQGVLKNAAGTAAITGAKNITFALYTVATGGTAIWGRTVAVNLDDSGLFNVDLTDSNGSALAGASNANLVNALKVARSGTLYVGLTVEGSSGEIQPRQKILMTPYASWAADATNASGDFNVAGKATVRNAEVTNELVVDGKTTLKGDVTFSQGMTISGPVTVKNTGSLSGFGTIPVGGIIMWSGSSVPAGWALCNGSNGTPDLRNFPVGVKLAGRTARRSNSRIYPPTATGTRATTIWARRTMATTAAANGQSLWLSAATMRPARILAMPGSGRHPSRLPTRRASRSTTARPTMS